MGRVQHQTIEVHAHTPTTNTVDLSGKAEVFVIDESTTEALAGHTLDMHKIFKVLSRRWPHGCTHKRSSNGPQHHHHHHTNRVATQTISQKRNKHIKVSFYCYFSQVHEKFCSVLFCASAPSDSLALSGTPHAMDTAVICVSESDDEEEVDDAGPAVVQSHTASTGWDERRTTSDKGAQLCNVDFDFQHRLVISCFYSVYS